MNRRPLLRRWSPHVKSRLPHRRSSRCRPAGLPFPRRFRRPPEHWNPPAQIRFGPGAAPAEAPPISVRAFITVEEEWTDNANLQKTNREAEFRTRVAPGVALSVQRQQSTVQT